MFQIQRKILTSAVFALVVFCSGCASNSFLGPVRRASNDQIEVVRVTTLRKQDGILIYGDVRRKDGRANGMAGHLHFVGTNDTGQIVAVADAPWGDFINRRLRRAYFKVFLSCPTPIAVSAINIEVVLTANTRITA